MSEGRRYQILGVLGKGGFGTVYKAELLGEGGFTRKVALKVLNADMVAVEDVAKRLRDEARLLGLLRHRAILHVDGLVRLNNRWTVVMEYIEGSDLHALTHFQAVPLGPTLEIIGEVASALHVAYTWTSPKGVPLRLLHRDIKPPNIILTSAGEIKVLDFGIARAEFGGREARTQSVLYGSLGYMAPERLDFEELPEGDVYALGTVMYELLLADPFGKASIRPEKHEKRVADAVALLRKRFASAPPEFFELISSMLSYDPEDRPNAREVERRCRTLRSNIDGPWLRDWAEEAVPPVLKARSKLKQDDFSGSIVVEAVGNEMIVEADRDPTLSSSGEQGGVAVPTRADETFKLSGSQEASGTVFTHNPPTQSTESSGRMGFVVGSVSAMGCLLVGGVGFAVALLAVLIVMQSPDPVAVRVVPAPVPTVGPIPHPSVTPPPAPSAAPVDDGEHFGKPTGIQFQAALTEPWSSMGLPIGHGNITYSDEKTLVVTYGKGPLRVMAERWEPRMLEAGWTKEYDVSGPDAVSMTFKRDGGLQASMAVVPSMGNTLVSVSQF